MNRPVLTKLTWARATLVVALFLSLSGVVWADVFTVVNTQDHGVGTLRDALDAANSNAGPDTIAFAIPQTDSNYNREGLGEYTIKLEKVLKLTDAATTIDGTTQPGFAGSPLIQLEGNPPPTAPGYEAMKITGGACTVRGLVINKFPQEGIELSGNGGNVVVGNYIGTDVTGTVARKNGRAGIAVSSSGNVIGGTAVSDRNVISGNDRDGITLGGDDNVVSGNRIGTDAGGTLPVPNRGSGIEVTGARNTIGGLVPGAPNVVSGNEEDGIHIDSGADNLVQGNYVGTDANGSSELGNGVNGILVDGSATGNSIGGTSATARNVISGNGATGVEINGNGTTGNAVLGNAIGTDATGSLDLGNNLSGVLIDKASSNTVGGETAGAANIIAYNGEDGVRVSGSLLGVSVRWNSIHDNALLGIDLGGDGVTPNDAGDLDGGPNLLQNHPNVTAAALYGGNTLINAILESAAGTTFQVDFYSSDSPDPSGHGEGRVHVASRAVNTDAAGSAFVGESLSALPLGTQLTLTATDPAGNTSEFGNAIAVTDAASVSDLTLTNDDGIALYTPGSTVVYTLVAANTGPGDVIGAKVTLRLMSLPQVTGVDWHCEGTSGASCTAGPVAGDVDDTVDLPAGSAATYTVNVQLGTAATGDLVSEASVTPPLGVVDLDVSNNSAADVDSQGPWVADLAITKDDGLTQYAGGDPLTYTIVVTNAGPSDAGLATVTDLLSSVPQIASATWSCTPTGLATCTENSVVGDINDSVFLPVGETLTFTVDVDTDPFAIGDLINTATVTPGPGGSDPQPLNDSATDQDAPVQGPLEINPTPNIETIPAGSLIIAMDNDKQNLGGAPFNPKAYGLVTHLLWDEIPVKWAIRAGKAKDGVDFQASAARVFPSTTPPATLDFRGGPFIVTAGFAYDALSRIASFGGDVAVYELLVETPVDVRHTLTHKPKVAALDDGGNAGIHMDVLDRAGLVRGVHYDEISVATLTNINASSCFTLASEAHCNDDKCADAQVEAARAFTESGANFLAQCAAILAYENSPAHGLFQTTNGVVEDNLGNAGFAYPQPDLPFGQFQGLLASTGGSVNDFELALHSGFQNDGHLHVHDLSQPDHYVATAAQLTPGPGSHVFYLGGHDYDGGGLDDLNGQRMYLNAVMTPVRRPPPCGLNFSPVPEIGGVVVEDTNGDGDLAGEPGRPGVEVRLYLDGGNAAPDGADDALVDTATTGADGSYLFQGLVPGRRYWVTVDSKTITPGAGFNAGSSQVDVWAEQTHGPRGSWCDGGDVLAQGGPCFGGRNATVSDQGSSLATSEHLAGRLLGLAIHDLDFGFSFVTIVNPLDALEGDGGGTRSAQGSLRQFFQNSNAISGVQTSTFRIPSNSGTFDGTSFRITPTSELPVLLDPLIVDGRTQPGFAGKPVIELDGTQAGGAALLIEAGSSTVRGLVINRFQRGIQLEVNGGNVVEGNFIGTDATGTTAIENTSEGVQIRCEGNRIGGADPLSRNLISGNAKEGIKIDGADNVVQGNFIGTDVSGTIGLGNRGAGINARGENVLIGGVADGEGNLVSANEKEGVLVRNEPGCVVAGNLIGSAASGTGDLGNGRSGVLVDKASGTIVGGSVPGATNTIVYNGENGVTVKSAYGVSILRNAIFQNDLLGIDLDDDGVTPNDEDDPDDGANGLQNFPVITAVVVAAGQTTIEGLLNSTPSTTFTIQFFASDVADPGSFGEGQRYMREIVVTTDPAGNAPFTAMVPATVAGDEVVTAAVTAPDGSTSEFNVAFTFVELTGTVYEDIDGDGDPQENAGRPSVRVLLYSDGGDGVPTGDDDLLLESIVTDADGFYAFPGVLPGSYWVVADSRTISSEATLRTSFIATDIWAEQTYGSTGAWCDDGALGTAELKAAGPCFGGRRALVSDNPSTLATAEHLTHVLVGDDAVNGVDFGFSFVSIVHTRTGNDDVAVNRSIQGSLRQFVQNSNAIEGVQTSAFRIPTSDPEYDNEGMGEFTVIPEQALPEITDPIFLDGATQPGYSGEPLIVLDGRQANSADGLRIVSGDSTIRALTINAFEGDGIDLATSGGNLIEANWIGVKATGQSADANDAQGIRIEGHGNVIGGMAAGQANVVAGNKLNGILISGPAATGNLVQGNLVGTSSDGGVAVKNNRNGVEIADGSSGNTIGGIVAEAGNLISGNAFAGVALTGVDTTGNQVQGNYIGTTSSGSGSLPNRIDGVVLSAGARGNNIGGRDPGAGNVISGNESSGVHLLGPGTTDNRIEGNYIGVGPDGTADLGNVGHGVWVDTASRNTIGGTSNGAGNRIGRNDRHGIYLLDSDDNAIQGNAIGSDPPGGQNLGNSGHGVLVEDSDGNAIGGSDSRASNRVAFNGDSGVSVVKTSAGNPIRRNSIVDNSELGIDLRADGVTGNDPADVDGGPNGLQNYPVLATAVIGLASTTIYGTLESAPSTPFTLDFYSSPAADPSGHGEGATFIGSANVTTDTSGHAALAETVPEVVTPGLQVTAITTGPSGNSSEFSAAVPAVEPNSGPSSCNVFVDQDAWLEEAKPSSNHGSDDDLQALQALNDVQRPILQFDLSGLTGSAIVSATAWFYVTDPDESGSAVAVHAITDGWAESTVTWSNTGADLDPLSRGSFAADAIGYTSVDLTALAQDWSDGSLPNHGLALLPGSVNVGSRFASREWPTRSQQPCMEIVTAAAANLAITKDDGVVTYTPGSSVTYDIKVSNTGPDAVRDAVVDDPVTSLPQVTSARWTCAASGGAVCTPGPVSGDLSDLVDLPVGSSVAYTLDVDLDAAASGDLTNTVNVSTPPGATDPDLLDNIASDTDTLAIVANLGITKDDGVTSYVPGDSVIYTIVVGNPGPAEVTGAAVVDSVTTLPQVADASWTCVGAGGATCTAGPVVGDINDLVDLPVDGTATYTLTVNLRPDASGDLVNEAGVVMPNGANDPDPSNNTVIDTDTAGGPVADLQIGIDDGVTVYTPGTSLSYEITVGNTGPSPATGATVNAALMALPQVSGASWSCVASGGASCTPGPVVGDLVDVVDLPVGGEATFTLVLDVAPDATGDLVATASIAAPADVTDPDSDNNNATDTDSAGAPVADLRILKDDGVASYSPGGSVIYTIVVSNAGPSSVTGASVSDNVNALPQVASASWSCSAGPGASCATDPGTGDLTDSADLPPDGQVTYTLTVNLDPSATGDLVNLAEVSGPAGVVDPDPDNNRSTDTDTPGTPVADLSITKSDGVASYTPGGTVTYIVSARNAGPAAVIGAAVTDAVTALPQVAGASWSCAAAGGASCTAGPVAGDIIDTLDLPVGAAATYTLVVDLDPAATDDLVNAASIVPPAGTVEADATDNTATDTDSPGPPSADLSISLDDGVPDYTPGDTVTYTIVVGNAGPSAIAGATVTDSLTSLPQVEDVTWSCVAAGGATCTPGPVGGDLADTIALPVGASATYTVIVGLDPAATGDLVNTAHVSVPAGSVDPAAGNDSATDIDSQGTPLADLAISKSDAALSYFPGGSVDYTIVVTNLGPSAVSGATVSDPVTGLPQVTGASWSCLAGPGASCTAGPQGGDLTDITDLWPGSQVTYTLSVTLDSSATGDLVNTASVAVSAGTVDLVASNDSATDTNTEGTALADLWITNDDGVTAYVPGESLTYTIVVGNTGPSAISGAAVTDTVTALPQISNASWTCVPTGGASCTLGPVVGDLNDTVDLPVDSSATYTLVVGVDPAAMGDLVNVATITTPSGAAEVSSANNTATDTDVRGTGTAELGITKTDGVTSYTPGGTLTYSIVVSNAGPSAANGVAVSDAVTALPQVASASWTCAAAAGASCTGGPVVGDINDSVNLPAGSSVTYTLAVQLSPDAGGDLANSAILTLPDDTTDPTPINTASDIDTEGGGVADLGVTMTDGVTSYTPGGNLTYTIVVSNAGPSSLSGATITDLVSTVPQISGASWSCVPAGGASCGTGTGDLSDTLDLPVGSTATYTLVVDLDPGSTGSLTNMVSVATPAGVTDPDPNDDSVTDVDDQGASVAQLAISKTDGVTSYTPGETVTYTILVSNAGPSSVTGVTVSDAVIGLSQVASASWTCTATTGATCTAGPVAGNVSDSIDLPAGGSATYLLTVDLRPDATGDLVNTASLVTPPGTVDPVAGDTSSTDIDTPGGPVADLSISKDDGVSSYSPGGSVTYTIVVGNAGPSALSGASVTDTVTTQPQVTGASWTCTGSGGANCTAGPVAGDLADTIDLPVGATVTYLLEVDLASTAAGDLVNTASVAPPAGATDPDPNDDIATDTDTQGPAQADLSISKDDGASSYTPGATVTYTIVVSNAGPSPATGVTVDDGVTGLPQVEGASWTCSPSGGASCAAGPVVGDLSDLADLPAGGSATYTLAVELKPDATGDLVNTASLGLPTDVDDPTPTDLVATDTDTQGPPAGDLSITIDDGVTSYLPGGTVTYTIVVLNAGPSAIDAAQVSCPVTALPQVTGASWTCVAAAGSVCTTGPIAGDLVDSVDLPVDGSVTYTLVADIDPGATGDLVTDAAVAAPAGSTDPNAANDSATDSDTQGAPAADLSLTKSVDDPTPGVGSNVSFTLTVANSGPSTATGVVITDLLPDGYAYVTDDSSLTGTSYLPASGIWSVGSLAPGASLALNITVEVQLLGTYGSSDYTNVAEIASANESDPDSIPGNGAGNNEDDEASQATMPNFPPLAVDDSDTTLVDTSVGIDVLANDSDPNSDPLTISAVDDPTPQGGSATIDDNDTPADPSDDRIVYAPASGFTGVDTFNYTVEDGHGGSAAATVTVTVTDPVADLSLGLAVSNSTPPVGTSVVFQLILSNAGPQDATGVVAQALLPAGFSYAAHSGDGSYDGLTGQWTAGTVAAGTQATLDITALVNPTGAYITTAEVTASNQTDSDSTPGNGVGAGEDDEASLSPTPVAMADLALDLVVDNPNPEIGTNVVFQLTVTNAGPSDATGVLASDPLPSGYVYVADDSAFSGTTYDPATGLFNVGALPAGASVMLRLTAEVALAGDYTNVAEVLSADQQDPDSVHGNGIGNGEDDEDTQGTAPDGTTPVVLTKAAAKGEVYIGEVVTYSVVLQNTEVIDLPDTRVEDSIPPNFKYIAGSSRLNGAPLADPSGSRPLIFEIGLLPALGDLNGNGVADPGEPGYAVLTYQLVVGSGARPGSSVNKAIATMVCDGCAISNESNARVEIRLDPVLDLGTIIGKVFEDHDHDGHQRAGEPGVPNAMVVLDDGTYALTDEHGKYHFPVVRPGQRLVKLNLLSLPPGAETTTREAQVLWATPGLMVQANFGVAFETSEETIGRPAETALQVTAEAPQAPIQVHGNAEVLSLLVNDRRVALPSSDVQLRFQALDDVIQLTGSTLEEPVRFDLQYGPDEPADGWVLEILDGAGTPLRLYTGEGVPPEAIEWDGRTEQGVLVNAGEVYQYQLRVDHGDARSTSGRRLFGVNRESVISLALTGKAFASGEAVLSEAAEEILREAAVILAAFPDEKVVIEGHTDSVGTEASNLDLSRRRAAAAAEFMVERLSFPADRIVLRWFGEERPVASNELDEGRELNRRVELKADVEEVDTARIADAYRTIPSVSINGAEVEIGSRGRFSSSVHAEPANRLEIEVRNSEGRTVRTTVRIPDFEITAPRGEALVTGSVGELGCVEVSRFDRTMSSVNGGNSAALNGGIPVEGPSSDEIAVTSLPTSAAVRCRLEGRTEPGNTVDFDGRAVELAPDGRFEGELELAVGENSFGVLVRNPEGFSRTAMLSVRVADRDEDGHYLVITEPIPNLTVTLPPIDAKLPSSLLTVTGRTDPGNSITVNGDAVEVKQDGSFVAAVELPRGKSILEIRVQDPRGATGSIEREVDVVKNELFLMAFADTAVGTLQSEGYIQGAGADEKDEYFASGRLAFYAKGTIQGKYLLSAAFDSGLSDNEPFFSDLDPNDSNTLLRNLDPDRVYPVYGDSSTVVFDAQSQGKLYLALDSKTIHLLIGDFPIALSDTELATYRRTLYGGRFAYQSVSKTKYGDPDTQVVLFAANLEQEHVTDELQGTGGSLYYLSHDDVIEGSEIVELVVRDKNTGLILSRKRQRQNVDYRIKYPEGRVVFHRPIPMVVQGGTLFDHAVLQGNPVFVQVDYESKLDDFDQTIGGGRVRQQIGDHVAVGGTYISDELDAGSYELSALDSTLRFGQNTRLTLEYAESTGRDSEGFASPDGGLTYQRVDDTGEQEGSAFKVAADLDVGEWFGDPDKYRVIAYFKELDPGFFSNGNQLERGTRKAGVGATVKLSAVDSLDVRHDREERSGDALTAPGAVAELNQSAVRYERRKDGWGLIAELFSAESSDDTGNLIERSTYGIARFWKKISKKLTAQIEHQQTVSGLDNDQTSLGVQYQVIPNLALDLVGSTGDRGNSAQAGAILTVGESEVYLTERVVADRAGNNMSTVLGARSPIGRATTVYTEYQIENGPAGDRAISLVGLQRQWDIQPGFRFVLSGERADVESPSLEQNRSALATSLSYAKGDRLAIVSRNEFRLTGGDRAEQQFLTMNRVEYRLDGNFMLLASYRYSESEERDTDAVTAKLDERVLGLALRPVHTSRYNGLLRYTRLLDNRPQFGGPTLQTGQVLEVFSLDTSWWFQRRVEWVTKTAFRTQEDSLIDMPSIESTTFLAVQRFNFNLWKPVDLGIEYRWRSQSEADDQKQGWLGEASWRLQDHFRLGLGYNFTDFSDNEFSQNDYSVHGLFLRIQGLY